MNILGISMFVLIFGLIFEQFVEDFGWIKAIKAFTIAMGGALLVYLAAYLICK